jgi:tryptophanyl-tRNA synthetase
LTKIHFRLTRDVAPRMKLHKPALIHNKFFPALQGSQTKMSAAKQIEKKINKHAFSGGQETLELQRELGANLEIDIPYQWLPFFLMDKERLNEIGTKYENGQMLTGEVKTELITILQKLVGNHQANRSKISDQDVTNFMQVRELEF